MPDYAVFVKEVGVAFNRYIVSAESKGQAIRLAKEGKAGTPKTIEVEVGNPKTIEAVGYDYAIVDDYRGDFDALLEGSDDWFDIPKDEEDASSTEN